VDVKQVDAGLLNVGYVDAGPSDGPAVLLLHGWPYDIYSYAEVTPWLAAAGNRGIVPYVRGFGTTRFLSEATVRNGQPTALASDAVALMDASGGPGVGERLPHRQPGSEHGLAVRGLA
jgi:pimeloyl-ACP methyl ester carboxylesterase